MYASNHVALTSAHVIAGNNFYFYDDMVFTMSTQFRTLQNGAVSSRVSNADSIIADNAMVAEGDLLISVGWGDGFAIHQVSDAGVITQKYIDLYPANSYAYYHNLALDRVRKVAYVGNYSYAGVTAYDYSDINNVTKIKTFTKADGLPADQVGYSYIDGISIAGDYLYLSPYGASTAGQMRWNTQTGVGETLAVTNRRNTGRYGAVYYSERTDRIYTHHYDGGEIWVTLNASTAAAKSYCIRIYDAGSGSTSSRFFGVVEDNANPNILIVGAYFAVLKIDITPCITDPVATGAKPISIWASTMLNSRPYLATGYHSLAANLHPDYGSDFIKILPDRGILESGGWFDQDNNMLVGPPDRSAYTSHDTLQYDYAPSPVLIRTANGTRYWIYTGYSRDGARFYVYRYEDGVLLFEQSDATFGTFTISGNKEIGYIEMNNFTFNLPSGCSVTYLVSNNNGATWEAYNGNQHEFNSVGYQARVKVLLNGTPIKAPHLRGSSPPVVTIMEREAVDRKSKTTSYRLGGKA